MIADYLENHLTPRDLCDEKYRGRVEAGVEAMLEGVEDTLSGKVRPCDIQKLIESLKLRQTCRNDDIPK
jgi:hypothetical protein